MFCEKCGAGLREGDRFCSQCGAPVKDGLPLPSVPGKEKEQGEDEEYLEEEDYLDEEADQEDLLETEPGRYLLREDWETDENPADARFEGDRSAGDTRERQGARGGRQGQVYYDENLYREYKGRYRDSFLEKKEDKSHAMLTTVTILLVMAVLVAAFMILFFFMTRSHPQVPEGDPAGIEILSEETRIEECQEIWDTETIQI